MKQISRCVFIKNTGGAGIALLLGIYARGGTGKAVHAAGPKNFTPYILIESNGNITIYNSKPKMRQGAFQSIPALIAEELEVSLEQVTIKLTNGEKEFGLQHAGGSSSVRTTCDDLRKVGAAAKERFIKAAGKK